MAARKTVAINPTFKLAVQINAGLCILSALAAGVIAYYPPHSEAMEQKLFWLFEHAFLMGSGAFIGLLGGRAAAPDKSE